MLRKTIYSMPIIILTMVAASAQDGQELRDIKDGQNSFRIVELCFVRALESTCAFMCLVDKVYVRT